MKGVVLYAALFAAVGAQFPAEVACDYFNDEKESSARLCGVSNSFSQVAENVFSECSTQTAQSQSIKCSGGSCPGSFPNGSRVQVSGFSDDLQFSSNIVTGLEATSGLAALENSVSVKVDQKKTYAASATGLAAESANNAGVLDGAFEDPNAGEFGSQFSIKSDLSSDPDSPLSVGLRLPSNTGSLKVGQQLQLQAKKLASATPSDQSNYVLSAYGKADSQLQYTSLISQRATRGGAITTFLSPQANDFVFVGRCASTQGVLASGVVNPAPNPLSVSAADDFGAFRNHAPSGSSWSLYSVLKAATTPIPTLSGSEILSFNCGLARQEQANGTSSTPNSSREVYGVSQDTYVEVMRISNISGSTLTVDRGAFSTSARAKQNMTAAFIFRRGSFASGWHTNLRPGPDFNLMLPETIRGTEAIPGGCTAGADGLRSISDLCPIAIPIDYMFNVASVGTGSAGTAEFRAFMGDTAANAGLAGATANDNFEFREGPNTNLAGQATITTARFTGGTDTRAYSNTGTYVLGLFPRLSNGWIRGGTTNNGQTVNAFSNSDRGLFNAGGLAELIELGPNQTLGKQWLLQIFACIGQVNNSADANFKARSAVRDSAPEFNGIGIRANSLQTGALNECNAGSLITNAALGDITTETDFNTADDDGSPHVSLAGSLGTGTGEVTVDPDGAGGTPESAVWFTGNSNASNTDYPAISLQSIAYVARHIGQEFEEVDPPAGANIPAWRRADAYWSFFSPDEIDDSEQVRGKFVRELYIRQRAPRSEARATDNATANLAPEIGTIVAERDLQNGSRVLVPWTAVSAGHLSSAADSSSATVGAVVRDAGATVPFSVQRGSIDNVAQFDLRAENNTTLVFDDSSPLFVGFTSSAGVTGRAKLVWPASANVVRQLDSIEIVSTSGGQLAAGDKITITQKQAWDVGNDNGTDTATCNTGAAGFVNFLTNKGTGSAPCRGQAFSTRNATRSITITVPLRVNSSPWVENEVLMVARDQSDSTFTLFRTNPVTGVVGSQAPIPTSGTANFAQIECAANFNCCAQTSSATTLRCVDAACGAGQQRKQQGSACTFQAETQKIEVKAQRNSLGEGADTERGELSLSYGLYVARGAVSVGDLLRSSKQGSFLVTRVTRGDRCTDQGAQYDYRVRSCQTGNGNLAGVDFVDVRELSSSLQAANNLTGSDITNATLETADAFLSKWGFSVSDAPEIAGELVCLDNNLVSRTRAEADELARFPICSREGTTTTLFSKFYDLGSWERVSCKNDEDGENSCCERARLPCMESDAQDAGASCPFHDPAKECSARAISGAEFTVQRVLDENDQFVLPSAALQAASGGNAPINAEDRVQLRLANIGRDILRRDIGLDATLQFKEVFKVIAVNAGASTIQLQRMGAQTTQENIDIFFDYLAQNAPSDRNLFGELKIAKLECERPADCCSDKERKACSSLEAPPASSFARLDKSGSCEVDASKTVCVNPLECFTPQRCSESGVFQIRINLCSSDGSDAGCEATASTSNSQLRSQLCEVVQNALAASEANGGVAALTPSCRPASAAAATGARRLQETTARCNCSWQSGVSQAQLQARFASAQFRDALAKSTTNAGNSLAASLKSNAALIDNVFFDEHNSNCCSTAGLSNARLAVFDAPATGAKSVKVVCEDSTESLEATCQAGGALIKKENSKECPKNNPGTPAPTTAPLSTGASTTGAGGSGTTAASAAPGSTTAARPLNKRDCAQPSNTASEAKGSPVRYNCLVTGNLAHNQGCQVSCADTAQCAANGCNVNTDRVTCLDGTLAPQVQCTARVGSISTVPPTVSSQTTKPVSTSVSTNAPVTSPKTTTAATTTTTATPVTTSPSTSAPKAKDCARPAAWDGIVATGICGKVENDKFCTIKCADATKQPAATQIKCKNGSFQGVPSCVSIVKTSTPPSGARSMSVMVVAAVSALLSL